MASGPGNSGRYNAGKVGVALHAGAILALLGPALADAEEHVVRTRASQWVPLVLFIQPGDTVIWQGMATHETELIDGMGPEGAPGWKSELDAEGYSVTLEQAGAYIYQCAVHMYAGMAGAIVVGDGEPQNLEAIEAAIPSVEEGRVFVERVIGRMKRELNRRAARR